MKTLFDGVSLCKAPKVKYRAKLFMEVDGKVVNEIDINVHSYETNRDFNEWLDDDRTINYVPHPFVNVTLRGHIVPEPAKPVGPSLNQKRAKRDWHNMQLVEVDE